MAISVDFSSWPYLITFAQSDLTLVSGTKYEITVNKMWELLRDFSDNFDGMPVPATYRRTPATATTPAITEINDPAYAAEFEDGAYSVNIIGGNSNFREVEVKNQVSVGTNNSAGFISTGTGLSATEQSQLQALYEGAKNKRKWDKNANKLYIYDVDDVTVLHEFDTNADLSEITPV